MHIKFNDSLCAFYILPWIPIYLKKKSIRTFWFWTYFIDTYHAWNFRVTKMNYSSNGVLCVVQFSETIDIFSQYYTGERSSIPGTRPFVVRHYSQMHHCLEKRYHGTRRLMNLYSRERKYTHTHTHIHLYYVFFSLFQMVRGRSGRNSCTRSIILEPTCSDSWKIRSADGRRQRLSEIARCTLYFVF